jgi:hypothetical protein
MKVNGTLWFELHHMDVKVAFPNGICKKMNTWHGLKVMSWKEKNARDATYRNDFKG